MLFIIGVWLVGIFRIDLEVQSESVDFLLIDLINETLQVRDLALDYLLLELPSALCRRQEQEELVDESKGQHIRHNRILPVFLALRQAPDSVEVCRHQQKEEDPAQIGVRCVRILDTRSRLFSRGQHFIVEPNHVINAFVLAAFGLVLPVLFLVTNLLLGVQRRLDLGVLLLFKVQPHFLDDFFQALLRHL